MNLGPKTFREKEAWGAALLAVLGLALFPLSALATGGDRIPGSRYVSGRGAALGDAYIGFADTVADGLFYNPAALGKIQRPTFEPLNGTIQVNNKLTSNLGTDFYKFQSLGDYQSNLSKTPHRNPGGAYALLPAIGFAGFGVGLLYQSRLMAETDGTNVRYRSVYQFIPSVGYGIKLASGVLRMGYVIQWVNQASGDVTKPVGSTPMSWKEGIAQGQGFSQNFGMTVTLPYVYQPSFNVVARNIAGLRFSGKPMFVSADHPSGTPAKENMSLDTSFGFMNKLSGGWRLDTQLAWRDATNASKTRLIEHGAVGFEFTALDHFFLRAGFGSGYPSAGLGIRSSRAELNFAWFSEDLGDGTTPQRDMRYLFQFLFKAF